MRRLALALSASLAACSGSTASSKPTPPIDHQPPPITAADANAFLDRVNKELYTLDVNASVAEWANETDLTPEHEAATAKTSEEVSVYVTNAIKESHKYDAVLSQLEPDRQRMFQLLRVGGQPSPDDPALAKELAENTSKMTSIYGESKWCDAKGKCLDLDAIEDFMAKSRDPDALLAAWQGWHDTTGRAERDLYKRFVELENAGAKGVGFADAGELWRSRYDMSPAEFEAEVDRLWGQVKPLYSSLQCYAHRKLTKLYGKKLVPENGLLPAHLMGNMWAQTWTNLYPELEPFAKVAPLDVTPALVKQKYDPIKMAKTAEGFFTSLGLDPLPDTFWQRSMFAKPDGKEVVCHASAWDVTFSNDLRIKMCVHIDQEDLGVLHHEIGHDYYFHAYYQRPILFQDGANDGFHEAIGDAVAMSVTPTYLKQLGLLDKVAVGDKAVINQQMRVALEKIAFLPFGLLVDKWRWDVFAGKVQPADYNAHWWKLRQKYQGVAAPIARAAEDFDPGAKFHVPGNTPYARYFLAAVLMFQFHKALCAKAGWTGPLHECSIYGSKEAGKALQAMLALGASKPWPDALEVLTGTRQMDAGPMLEYFSPLAKWLEAQNKGQQCGWPEE